MSKIKDMIRAAAGIVAKTVCGVGIAATVGNGIGYLQAGHEPEELPSDDPKVVAQKEENTHDMAKWAKVAFFAGAVAAMCSKKKVEESSEENVQAAPTTAPRSRSTALS